MEPGSCGATTEVGALVGMLANHGVEGRGELTGF